MRAFFFCLFKLNSSAEITVGSNVVYAKVHKVTDYGKVVYRPKIYFMSHFVRFSNDIARAEGEHQVYVVTFV